MGLYLLNYAGSSGCYGGNEISSTIGLTSITVRKKEGNIAERLIGGHVIIKPKCVTLSWSTMHGHMHHNICLHSSTLAPSEAFFTVLSDHLARGAHT